MARALRGAPAPAPPADARARLIRAQDRARSDPAFQPKIKTFCNQATVSIVREVGAPLAPLLDRDGLPLLANAQARNLARSRDYTELTPEEVQQAADRGDLVIAAWEDASGESGHVATVRPAGVEGDAPIEGSGPMLNDIGRHVGVRRRSQAFGREKVVRYYTPAD